MANSIPIGTLPRSVPELDYQRDVRVDRQDRYSIRVERNALDVWPARLTEAVGEARIWVVTDETVWAELGDRFSAAERADRLVGGVLTLPCGELSKSLSTWQRIISWFAENGVGRRDVVVAFGGSMVSDTAGFAAACYMRGIPYANVPTSLLAQVDGAVGGKVAVNLPEGKNLVGDFHHPVFVLCDPTTLCSLPDAEISNGLAEVIKSFAISADGQFGELEHLLPLCRGRDVAALTWIVRTAIDQKMNLVDPDPYEADLRRALNFGHTVGHALETSKSYSSIRHGEAVGIGMATATRLGLSRGITDAVGAQRILGAIAAAGLDDRVSVQLAPEVVRNTELIAKIRGGNLRYVVPRTLGAVEYLEDVDPDELATAATGTALVARGPA
ncbi:3-dehydroquinate synthase [Streptomyces sp. NBS 14/10]|uniref:3-dehydroquinate synthase n=1 Tax=Streptomyces sp. NBS 14/10 TaxID=1945643 RepID=UPI000B7DDE78|nr:3-dehydroquinate synthase family protein [Streptomyces sp. NBS 14/10]KAK1184385.1 3-dehydroquinate synthase [Streptomyces sp. NBS 14/10]